MQENEKKTVLRAPKAVELKDSLESIKEYRVVGEEKHYYYVRIILLITDIIILGIGIYILIKHNKFLDINFKYHKLLLILVYIYSPSAIGIFFISFVISLFIYCFFCCCEKQKIHGAPLYDESDITMSIGTLKDNEDDEKQKEKEKENKVDIENSMENESEDNASEPKKIEIKEEFIGITADKVTLLPYTCSIFVIMTIIFYFAALPITIILLKNMWKHQAYKDKKEYWALYTFIFTILINGILLVYVFCHMFLAKRIENHFLKKSMKLDEDLLKNVTTEVREALKKA